MCNVVTEHRPTSMLSCADISTKKKESCMNLDLLQARYARRFMPEFIVMGSSVLLLVALDKKHRIIRVCQKLSGSNPDLPHFF